MSFHLSRRLILEKTLPGLRNLATVNRGKVRIVEVGPRDGLQNEKTIIPTPMKVRLIERLGESGLQTIESGSFVSPKWVPQMAGTADVLLGIHQQRTVKYPVLIPNLKGLNALVELLESHPPSMASDPPLTDEIAVFVAASESFSKANINCSISESLDRLQPVFRLARFKGLRVRGYVSTVITCPFEGYISPEKVKEIAKALYEMGCYEISLGDTVGTGTPMSIEKLLHAVTGVVPIENLAAHMHDTFGLGVANTLTAVEAGVRTVDSSGKVFFVRDKVYSFDVGLPLEVSGLGGCPYSPGATGNVATEDVVHALHGVGYATGVDLDSLAETGKWISNLLGRANGSRAGPALLAKRERERQATAIHAKANL